MSCIYKIVNNINGKVYIGQTRTTLKERMSKHYSDARCEPGITGIDAAIRKYGEQNFSVEILCECKNEELDRLEKFYISEYNSFNSPKGYNLTPGGQDTSAWSLNLDNQEVVKVYSELRQVNKTAEYFHCSMPVISRILHQEGIEIYRPGRVENIIGKGKPFQVGEGVKPVRIVELDKSFGSLKECAQWLIDNKYSKANSMEMARKSLSRCLSGKRQTYCKFHFKFI